MLASCAGFWSPDSKSFAYFGDSKLKRIDLDGSGGPSEPAVLCDASNAEGGTWNRDGLILFSTSAAIMQVADTGGVPSVVLRNNPGGGLATLGNPWFLPDGRHFLYEAFAPQFELAPKTIMAASLDAPQGKVLFDADAQPVFANGRIFYVKDEILLARRFDPRTLTATGEPTRVVDGIASSTGLSPFSVSDTGPLVYVAGAHTPPNEVVWFDRKGNRLESVTEVRLPTLQFSSPRLSPDRRILAIENRDQGRTDIWLYDMERKQGAPFTLDPSGPAAPVWSPDGRSIAFASKRKGHFDIYRRAADGSGEEQMLYANGDDKYPVNWSPDGRFLLFERLRSKSGRSTVWILPLTGESGSGQPFALGQSAGNEEQPEFSPDGRWISFTGDETGPRQVYLVPFRDGAVGTGGKRQISTTAGSRARWRKDGRELYYQESRRLMAVRVEPNGKVLQFSEPQELFSGVSILGYDTSADGQRFLLALRSRELGTLPLTVVLNWMATMRK
jgi:Tol biopolymer transport system component